MRKIFPILKAKDLVKGKVVAKVVDEMWTYLYKNAR